MSGPNATFSEPNRRLLICHLREARRKGRDVAIAEMRCLLDDLGATAPAGGPLAGQRGVFWIELPAGALEEATPRFARLGYTVAVDLLEPPAQAPSRPDPTRVRWRGAWYGLKRIYAEDPIAMRERAVDRRTFLLATPAGVRPTRGYRGNSRPLSRRGLAVADARLLVNLLGGGADGTFLEPFAGSGGVVLEALAAGWRCLSIDIDPALRYGLAALSGHHVVADIRSLPVAADSIDAVATEPPYDSEAIETLEQGLRELHRALLSHGRLVMLCAAAQAPRLRAGAAALGFESYVDAPVNRKGVAVTVLAWRKAV